MSTNNKQTSLTIGLFGFGVVGECLYQVIANTPTLNATIKKVCIKHPEKKRNAPHSLFTTDSQLLLDDEEINVIVELTNDPTDAYRIVTTAIKGNKSVVTANKKMIADNLKELIELQSKFGVPLLYEAACCASIPVIRNLEEYYDNDLLHSISGIINGSTNYILTKIAEENKSFEDALNEAQLAGFAETDPSLDVEGIDAVNKLSILLTHAYGSITLPSHILHAGITQLQLSDAAYAKEKGYVIKLLAHARKLADGSIIAFVLPRFVKADERLREVRNEYNGVEIESSLADKQFFYGKGAGGFPTASAVLSDLSALRYNYKYEYKKLNYTPPTLLSNEFYLHVSVSFNNTQIVAVQQFAQVDEWVINESGCRISGIVHASSLLQNDWWRQPGVSLVVLPQSVVEDFSSATTSGILSLIP